NGSEAVDISSINEGKKAENVAEEFDYRNEVINIFPEYKFALFNYGEEGKSTSTYKLIKEGGGEYRLYRYLVAEKFHHLERIIENYFRENEAKIYNSTNHNGGREIKIGITKEEFDKKETKNLKGRGKYFSGREMLETDWNLYTMTSNQPLTQVEKENYYRSLKERFQEQWPHRERLCREKAQRMEYSGNKENEKFLLARALANEIRAELDENKNIKICSDKCGYGLSKKTPIVPTQEQNSPVPISPKTGGTGKAANKKNNQIGDSEKSQLLSYFLAKNISKISLENGKLVIEYKNNNKKVIENEDQELTKYHQLIQNLPNQSLSLSELQSDNPNNSSAPSKNNTAIFISLAVGDYVVLVNAKYITFTGNNKLNNEFYYNHSGYPGGLRKRSTRLMLEKYPQELVMRIIKEGKINRIEIKNDGVRYNNERSMGKNYQKYQQFAPNTTQTDSWSSGEERKITTSGFSPTISYLEINFGNDNAKMAEYKANLQIGKKYHFNGDDLQNAKILTNKRLDLNNSADKVPEIR
ncbi:653_t:CDS:2, partial [Ambispora leptoticha]